MPPVPVDVPTPAPVRLNQSSRVNWDERRPGEAPIVTYCELPFSWTPKFVTAVGVAETSFEDADMLPELSTATTT